MSLGYFFSSRTGKLLSVLDFKSVNPIQTRGADYAPHTTASPPRLKKLSTPLYMVNRTYTFISFGKFFLPTHYQQLHAYQRGESTQCSGHRHQKNYSSDFLVYFTLRNITHAKFFKRPYPCCTARNSLVMPQRTKIENFVRKVTNLGVYMLFE